MVAVSEGARVVLVVVYSLRWCKKIPPKLLAARMETNITRMNDGLMNALRALPEDATEEERQMLLDTISESKDIEHLYREGIGKEKK